MLDNNKPRNLNDAIIKEAFSRSSGFSQAPVRNLARSFEKQADEIEKKTVDLYSQYARDPANAGLGDEKAIISQEEWIKDAAFLIKQEGAEIYLRTMMEALRKKFGGIPLLSSANKNDKCPCGSTKKFGKCCGLLVESDDPESCRAIGHDYGDWGKVKDSVWVHTCTKCPAVETADNVLEIGCEGEAVIVLPCRGCSAAPDQDAAWEIYSKVKKTLCIACKEAPKIKLLAIEHLKDGKHVRQWEQSILKWEEPVWTFSQFTGYVGEFILHTKCLKAHGVEVNENV